MYFSIYNTIYSLKLSTSFLVGSEVCAPTFCIASAAVFCPLIIDDLISYLLDNHKLGQGYIISKETLQTFLDLKNINTNINIQISLHFNGVKILNKTPDYLVLKSEQFPRLVSISINEGL